MKIEFDIEHRAPMARPIIDELGILPAYLTHISIPVDNIRTRGCEWIVNGERCRKPCAPFIFVCNEHRDIPDFPRYIYATADTCKKRRL